MIKWCCQVPKRFSKRKLQVVNTKTNRPIHPQPTSSKTYNPYAVLVPFTSVFLLEPTVNTCRKKETSNNFGGHLEFKSSITWSRVDQSDIFTSEDLSCITHAQLSKAADDTAAKWVRMLGFLAGFRSFSCFRLWSESYYNRESSSFVWFVTRKQESARWGWFCWKGLKLVVLCIKGLVLATKD